MRLQATKSVQPPEVTEFPRPEETEGENLTPEDPPPPGVFGVAEEEDDKDFTTPLVSTKPAPLSPPYAAA